MAQQPIQKSSHRYFDIIFQNMKEMYPKLKYILNHSDNYSDLELYNKVPYIYHGNSASIKFIHKDVFIFKWIHTE